jgi:mRNA-degrading endonuclease RelE of RelBE toxin-antitoxin system
MVQMTASAEAVYKDLYQKSKVAEELGHPESPHCTTFRMVEEAVKKIIPHDPLDKDYALRGHLSNIFRLRKGRMRIMWIASSAKRRVTILFISETLRKEGDANDPYEGFKRLFASGAFNDALKELGVRTMVVRKK